MATYDILIEDISDFASRLAAMTTDELYQTMKSLEDLSEKSLDDRAEALARIALVEDEIEQRFPGQLLATYRDWKKEQPLLS